ncbi:hypothetical protein F4808DRAFT_329315 [Astrocystis sublimbata]|nr:hypothetical protein F4808DRAFT_329315 [Astrocystis sublimbata]
MTVNYLSVPPTGRSLPEIPFCTQPRELETLTIGSPILTTIVVILVCMVRCWTTHVLLGHFNWVGTVISMVAAGK